MPHGGRLRRTPPHRARRSYRSGRRCTAPASTRSRTSGLRDAGTWLAGMAGQGLGSMQDPAVAAAIRQDIGTVAGFVPRLKGVAKLAPMLGAAAGFGINQRQMTGEMYGRLKQDQWRWRT